MYLDEELKVYEAAFIFLFTFSELSHLLYLPVSGSSSPSSLSARLYDVSPFFSKYF